MSGQNRAIQAHDDGAFEDLNEFSEAARDAALEPYQQILTTAAIAGAHCAWFLSKRMGEDIRLFTDLAACQNSREVIQTQHAFFQTMMSDYVGMQKKCCLLAHRTLLAGHNQC